MALTNSSAASRRLIAQLSEFLGEGEITEQFVALCQDSRIHGRATDALIAVRQVGASDELVTMTLGQLCNPDVESVDDETLDACVESVEEIDYVARGLLARSDCIYLMVGMPIGFAVAANVVPRVRGHDRFVMVSGRFGTLLATCAPDGDLATVTPDSERLFGDLSGDDRLYVIRQNHIDLRSQIATFMRERDRR